MSIKCPSCNCSYKKSSKQRTILSNGRYYRKSDGQGIRRFCCLRCKKSFSFATYNACFRQKKRHKNETIRRLLAGGVSQREAARILNLNRKTIVRKFLFLADKARLELLNHNASKPLATEVEFDDLETFEHSKCKPVSVTLIVEYKTRRILDFEVSQMPAKGKIAKLSRKKYGYRKDHRPQARKALFSRTQHLIHPYALIRSDSSPHYISDVKEFFPLARHETVLGGRGANTGQGELKKLKFDPIFSLNHTFAMFRANINRLFRKTWCTTKRKDRLRAHIAIYAMSHNQRISTA